MSLAFVGPTTFLVILLIVFVLILLLARVVFKLAWKLVVIGAIILLGLWLLSATSLATPGLGA